jgi:hypothetical protein
VAISGKYGQINISKIGGNEPVFILRAQDKLAQSAVEMYKVLADSHGATLTRQLDEEIKRFRDWNGGGKKRCQLRISLYSTGGSFGKLQYDRFSGTVFSYL